jgi:hypothetical protein
VRFDLDPQRVRELVPARDGSLVFVYAKRLRRILPSGQLDARFGTACGRPPLSAGKLGRSAAVTSEGGGALTTGTRFRGGAPPVSFVIRYGSDGCVAGRPLRVRAVSVGPPLLLGRHVALVGATDESKYPALATALALARIRR